MYFTWIWPFRLVFCTCFNSIHSWVCGQKLTDISFDFIFCMIGSYFTKRVEDLKTKKIFFIIDIYLLNIL